MTLSDSVIRNAIPRDKPFKLSDSKGLLLLVAPTGGKWWRLKYYFEGKEKQLSLGVYPEVTLSEARKRRDTYRSLLAQGIDPSFRRKQEKAAEAERASRTRPARFTLDNAGVLTLRIGRRNVVLSPDDTVELRAFLEATRAVTPKVPNVTD